MTKKLLLSLLALGVATVAAQAQTKIVTVNMAECFDAFHETEAVNQRMDTLRQGLEADLQERQRALEEKARPIQERIQDIQENPTMTIEAKQARLGELQAEVEPLRMEEAQLQQYAQQRQNEYRERFLRNRQTIIDKISNVATTIAIRDGAAILLDSSDASGAGVGTVIFRDQSLDITSKVITELNRDAPSRNAQQPAQP